MNLLLEEHFPTIAAGAIVVFSLLLGLLTRRLLLARIRRIAERHASGTADALLTSLHRPWAIWFVVGGLYLAQPLLKVSQEVTSLLDTTLRAVLIISVTFWLTDLITRILQRGTLPDGLSAPATGVVRHTARITVVAVGGLVLLSSLGISVTPILTTLGIGGLAVALGLQETLSNLFAGMQITLGRNIRVGDFIRLESGEEGFVDDIHWRVTRVRTLPNNFVLIPNSRLAQSVVTNYHRPSKDLAVLVQVGVHYASDLDHVERVTCDVARNIMKTVEGGIRDFEPFIRYHTFADSSINFTVILRAQAFTDNFLIKHEFIKALSRAYATEGIVIPFPIRAINLDQEQARSAFGRGTTGCPG